VAPLRIVVTGLAATFPLGGVFWDYLQYPLGLSRLGHDVLYLEDTGRWCYDPDTSTFVEDGSRNAAYLAREIMRLDPDLAGRWHFRDAIGNTWGLATTRVMEFIASADLFINISYSCRMIDEYFRAGRVAFIDSDPIYTQAAIPEYLAGTVDDAGRARIDLLRRHHVHFTFGENIGASDCLIPRELFRWRATRQPIVLDRFAPHALALSSRRRVLTTVLSWEPAEKGPIVSGIAYGGKGIEFEKFIDLPKSTAIPLELAIGGRAPMELLRTHGWLLVDAYSVSCDPWKYRDYLAGSLGEWSVAKNAYVASRSGWFSCRSACYLALGSPVVVQDTGFACAIPPGRGVLKFSTVDEARAAIDEVARDPERHSRAARDIAREYFDSSKVLTRLIDDALAS
jgi:hypothetical protein